MEIYKPKYIDEYTIRYDSMDEFYAIACTRLSEWEKNLVQWRNVCNALVSLQSFQGQAANAAKNYLQEVHNTLMPAILQTFSLYKAQFLLYKTGYYAIDGHTYSVIPEEVLRGIMGKLGAEIWDTELLSDDVNSVIDSIADICPLTKPSIDGLQTELDNVRGDVRAYKDKIDNYEYTKYTQTNGELQGLIDALDNTIKSFLETGENLATYQAGTISQNTELINLSEQVYAAGQYMLDNQAEIDAAIEQQTSIYAEIQAEQDRIFEEECRVRQEEGWTQLLEGGTLITAAVVVTLMSGCTTLPETIAVGVAGGTAMVCGAGLLTEGSQNVYYGSIGDLTSIAVNPVCEVFFGGNAKEFDTFCYYNMMFLTMYMMAGAGSVSGMVVEGVQEGVGDAVSTAFTSYLSSTCNLSDFESVLIGTTTSFLIDPGLDAIGSHSFGSGTHFCHLNNYTDIAPNVNPHLHANPLDWDTNIHILNDATDIPPNTLIDGVELPNHFYNDGVGVDSIDNIQFISSADRIKIDNWDYTPSDELYIKYKDVFDNPKYYNQETGAINWPSDDGFKTGSKIDKVIEKDTIFKRYGDLSGEFLGNATDSYEIRALAPHSENAEVHYYQLTENYKMTTGEVAPWFGSNGGAEQFVKYKSDGSKYTIKELEDLGILEDITDLVEKGEIEIDH